MPVGRCTLCAAGRKRAKKGRRGWRLEIGGKNSQSAFIFVMFRLGVYNDVFFASGGREKKFTCCADPCGLMVRTPGFHLGAPGSIPGMGKNCVDFVWLAFAGCPFGLFVGEDRRRCRRRFWRVRKGGGWEAGGIIRHDGWWRSQKRRLCHWSGTLFLWVAEVSRSEKEGGRKLI